MNRLLKSALAASVVLAFTCSAHAEEVKIGYVNSDRVLREAIPAKTAQAKLEAEFAKRDKDMADLAGKLKANSEKLEKEAPTLSESERSRRQRDLVEQDREFQRKRREFQEDLNSRKNEELQLVLERANKVVKQVAESEKYDLVLQDAVYINPKHDITDKVIKALNAQTGAK